MGGFWGVLFCLLAVGGLSLAGFGLMLAGREKGLEQGPVWLAFMGQVAGAFSFFSGLYVLVRSIMAIKSLGRTPVYWLSVFLAGVLLVLLGFMLGYPLLGRYIFRNPAARSAAQAMRRGLTRYSGGLGLLALALGAWFLVLRYH